MDERRRAVLEEVYAGWGRGDYSRGDFLTEDFELTFASGFLETGSFKGPREAWRGWKQWLDQWETWHYTPVEYFDLGDDRIAVFIDMRGVNRSTGIELLNEAANLWEFEGELIRRLTIYAHRDDIDVTLGPPASK